MKRIDILDVLIQEVPHLDLAAAMRVADRLESQHEDAVRIAVYNSTTTGVTNENFWFQGIQWNTTVDELIRDCKKIQAIKEVRRISGLSLKESKDAVEARERQLTY